MTDRYIDSPGGSTPGRGMEYDDGEAKSRPVHPDRCLFCKHPVDGDDPDAATVESGAGTERLCRSCLEDCRRFKRSRALMLLVSDGLDDAAIDVFQQQFDDIMTALQDRVGEDALPQYESHIRNAIYDRPYQSSSGNPRRRDDRTDE